MAYNQFGNQYGFQQYQNPYQTGMNQYQKSNLEWIMVNAVSDVDKVQVQPGAKAWVMVQNEPIFALRTADQMGLVQTDLYRFEKYTAPAEKAVQADYVTREQMAAAIAAAVSELKEARQNESTHRQNAAEQSYQYQGRPEPPEKPQYG